jgi:hypothetical protein
MRRDREGQRGQRARRQAQDFRGTVQFASWTQPKHAPAIPAGRSGFSGTAGRFRAVRGRATTPQIVGSSAGATGFDPALSVRVPPSQAAESPPPIGRQTRAFRRQGRVQRSFPVPSSHARAQASRGSRETPAWRRVCDVLPGRRLHRRARGDDRAPNPASIEPVHLGTGSITPMRQRARTRIGRVGTTK